MKSQKPKYKLVASLLVIPSKLSKIQKVVVAMSGGVDSSVAAALLKRAGFNVIGVFMKLFKDADSSRAKKVAEKLKIPFKIIDLQKEFKKKVINHFLEGYSRGITPNPCVVCNKEIKFGLLLEKALAMGADFVTTGHYACLQNGKLLRAKDKEKDQSYFLWLLNQRQLKRILFPIGDYTKTEVKKMAKKFKLSVFRTPESQEICFVHQSINDFLNKYIKQKTGKIIDKEGKILGTHQGLVFYTIGQRKGIGLPGGPYWVLDKDLKKNLLIVTKNEKDLLKRELTAKNVNWIQPVKCRKAAISSKTKLFNRVKAKIRYRHTPALATIYKLKTKTYKLIFNRPQRAVTPGQSVVFYKGNELLGGGIIC